MFAMDMEENCWTSMHHPFTAPRAQDRELLRTDRRNAGPGVRPRDQRLRSGGGTIRIHDQQLQQDVFRLLASTNRPPRTVWISVGRAAIRRSAARRDRIGIDRMVMLFGGLDNIRDVIAFPKTQRATDLMTGAPGLVDAKQLRELASRRPRDKLTILTIARRARMFRIRDYGL